MGFTINGVEINRLDVFDKMKVYLERNSYAKNFEIIRKEGLLLISFKTDIFDFERMKNMFWYWGLNYKDYFRSFRASPVSYRNVKIDIWLLKNSNYKDCNHNYVFNNGWNSDICNKCGYFKNDRNI